MADKLKPQGNPPIIDTSKLVDAKPDPRGDNRPGVYPDAPQSGIDPITNLREDLVDPETRLPKPVGDLPAEPLNPAPGDVHEGESETGELPARVPAGKMRMVAVSDIWPTEKPKGWPEDREYRIKSGETVDLPRKEALRRMEAGTAKRLNENDD